MNIESIPQAAIFNPRCSHSHNLEYQVAPGTTVAALKGALKEVLSNKPKEVELLIAFGKATWTQLHPNISPADLQDFQTLSGKNNHSIPSTQCDLYLWIQAHDLTVLAEALTAIQAALEPIATLSLEVAGFVNAECRDVTGFVDGTGNPKEDQRAAAAIIPNGEPGAGGSYLLAQKWNHKMKRFHGLSTHEQEQTIGRTKATDIELEGEQMPPNSHVSRTDVKVDGKAMKIWRRSSPFASAKEQGLYFLGFSCEIERFDIQLKRMLGLSEDNISDRLIEFSVAVSSSYLFAPSIGDLATAIS
ncbi:MULTISPECIES: Dyp-type peroxidase [unclassified Lentimonas]|uniref:Dyp-type peroxidase n=1 Tax=unclassified Lentimonas TaxID=2630993 RepID=UPI00132298FF|nr:MULTISPECIES: Dyp-type peroxidase [unclassified Lentimonas]CAA6677140.1 Unannotated [Lentimonas sp. CC4]CAA6686236.1 Unannotated [Lentimonas sp. CC6]CAA7074266.1 Unannotated [Lentimonas sp. CC4]CAA7171097.1 Unannotated [Lentimonas sp. CC21]CAA7180905.1 Unannotated [Lentimonas sp. CC8]